MDKKKLYVGNLPWSMTNDSLKEMFASYGEVVEAVIITDRMSGRSKGFGFVTFADEAAAEKAAAEMNGKTVEERQIVVNVARPREERPAGGGYRGGGGGGGFRRDNNRRPRF
ncbi:RNA-binding protein [Candidatus Roizmanbacteria bacterium]|nr:RNA-binding protein [Candidatus Roizmanbacteria bacterium]